MSQNAYRIKLLDIIDENPRTKTYVFEKPAALFWEPGTNAHFAFDEYKDCDPKDKTYSHHMSVNSLPDDGVVRFTTRIPGSHSIYKEKLALLKVGDEIEARAFGCRMPLKRENRPVALISMGVGISSFRTIIQSYLADRTGIPMMRQINIDHGDHVFYDQLNQMDVDGYENCFVNSRVQLYLYMDGAINDASIFYLIGSELFLKAVIAYLLQKGVSSEDIIIDKKSEKRAMFGL